MKRLSKIILIQWYRFEAIEIPVIGHTAIMGANGAGKSSILDAVQTVMTGGNKSRINLNRSSNQQSSRKLWEYVLGVLSDPRDPSIAEGTEPRKQATCYLALNFHDQATSETTCVGMCITANMKDMSETIEGYFICRGLVGSKGLFVEDWKEGGQAVIPWHRAKEKLVQLCPETKTYQKGNPGVFTEALYTALSENPSIPLHHKDVMKALQAAFQFEAISDPTAFIRKYILEPKDLRLGELRDQLQNYRDMAAKTESVSEQIAELSNLENLCNKVQANMQHQLIAQTVNLAAKVDAGEEAAEPIRNDLSVLEEQQEENLLLLEQLGEKQTSAVAQHAAYNYELQNLDYRLKKARLNGELETATQKQESAVRQIGELRRYLCSLADSNCIEAPNQLHVQLQRLQGIIPDGSVFDETLWPGEPKILDNKLESLRQAIEQTTQVLETTVTKPSVDIDRYEKEKNLLGNDITRLEKNKSPLDEETLDLIQFLKERGIEATPLCDIVEVKTSEIEWSETIESILGGTRQALIVEPDQAEEALHLYRYEARNKFPHRHIIKSNKYKEWAGLCKQGSLAECITTENPYARGFMNLRLGNILRVETDKDLLEHNGAATRDLMLTKGGTVTDLIRLAPLLGASAKKQRLIEARERYKQLDREILPPLYNLQKKLNSLNALVQQFERYYPQINPPWVSATVSQREKAHAEIFGLQKELEWLGSNKEEDRIKGEIAGLESILLDLKDKLQRASRVNNELVTQLTKKGLELQALEDKIGKWRLDQGIYRSNTNIDPATIADKYEQWREKFDQVLSNVAEHAQAEERRCHEAIDKGQREVERKIPEFLLRNSVEGPSEKAPDGYADCELFVSTRKNYLEKTELALYKNQAERALRAAENAFRQNFLGRLLDSIDDVKRLIDGLNKRLKNHPFHGEFYRFRETPNSEYKHILDFAKKSRDMKANEFGALFDPANELGSDYRKALDEITEALQDKAQAERLQDYRNYLVFTIETFNKEGQKITNLAHRIQKGSGGENQTPFYVAIGCSLSSAYRIGGTVDNLSGGLRLAIFDEAFNRLGMATCHSCAEFLKSLGLQLLLAAPDEKFGAIAGSINTVVWVTREGGTVEIDVQYLRPKTHKLLQSDMPLVPTEEQETAIEPA